MMQRPLPSGAVLLAFIALALLIHAPVMGLSFFSDDFSVIHRLGVQGDLGTGSFFRPLPDWTLYLNYIVAGPKAWAFRLVNVVLLGFNAWLLYLFGRNLFPESAGERWSIPLVAGTLFICYPYHNEPQLWIIGRSTAMATSFVLLALVGATMDRKRSVKCLLVGVCGALGTMCYELALLLPLLLLALWPVTVPEERRTWSALVIVAGTIAGANLFLRSALTGHVANEYGSSFFDRGVLVYIGMCGKVLGRLFLPPDPHPWTQVALFAGLLLALGVILFLLLRRSDADGRRRVAMIIALLVISCSIAVLGGISTRTSESDRFLYLPSAFLCLFLALTAFRLFASKTRWVVLSVTTILSLFSMHRNHLDWMIASQEIERIVEATPVAPSNGRLLVYGLPGEHKGAFIFRHGYREALEFAGKDPTRVRISPEGPNAIWEFLRTETGDTLHRNENDRWFDSRLKADRVSDSVSPP